jgi:hypothetical protein
LAATGIPLHLTEVDIDGLDDLSQLTEMQRVMPLFWEHEAVEGITLWGFRYGVWRQEQGAYLVNEDGSERPALIWLKAYINDTLQNVESIAVSGENGSTEITEKGGSLNMSALVLPTNATIPNVKWKVLPTSVATIDQNGVLTALEDGVATVTATAWDGSKVVGEVEIIISNQTTKISFDEAAIIKVFPNPSVNGKFNITLLDKNMKNTQLNIYNMNGQLVYNQVNLNFGSNEISALLNKGVYAIQVKGNNFNYISKIIVE